MISPATRIFGVICLFETGVMGDFRLCTSDLNGDVKYYVCHRNELCCKTGCCLSPSFQFYQLWYYWLMVIFMLVVCSGGQWWYKYWVGGGGEMVSRSGASHVIHRAQSTAMPTPSRSHLVAATSSATPSSSSPAPPSFTLIHQICKPHHYHLRGEGKVLSPYEQIYGPPPSYESVVGNGHSSSILPAYSPGLEPSSTVAPRSSGPVDSVNISTGSLSSCDPLGALERTSQREHCPTYAESEATRNICPEPSSDVHRRETQSHQLEANSTSQEEPSPSRSAHSVGESSNSITNSHRGSPVHNNRRHNRSNSHRSLDTVTTVNSESQTPPVHRTSQCLDHQQH